MNILLLLAGGAGSRAETEIPKQFVEVNLKPIIVHTLLVFQNCKEIDGICIVGHPDWLQTINNYKDKYQIKKIKWVVSGGRTGLESVTNGVRALSELSSDSLVLIHDSVRPFVTERVILENIRVAKKYGVAVTSVPCVETLIKVDEIGKSTQQIARDQLMRVMTPQTFTLQKLRELFEGVDVLNCEYPSTFALYMSKGYPVYSSYGSDRNIKITYPEDIEYLKNLFEK